MEKTSDEYIFVDLFCGAGGAAFGIHEAVPNARIIGIDIKQQPHYPFEFIQADALHFLTVLQGIKVTFYWASPPCQLWCRGTSKKRRSECIDYITPIRKLLRTTGIPYCIENVNNSTIHASLKLCGEMFGLQVVRHRKFECNFVTHQPVHKPHKEFSYYYIVAGHGGKRDTVETWKHAMGVTWECDRYELTQMVPPAYSKYIVTEFLQNRKSAGRWI